MLGQNTEYLVARGELPLPYTEIPAITSAAVPAGFQSLLRFATVFLKLGGDEKGMSTDLLHFTLRTPEPELKFVLCSRQKNLDLLPELTFRLWLSGSPFPRCCRLLALTLV